MGAIFLRIFILRTTFLQQALPCTSDIPKQQWVPERVVLLLRVMGFFCFPFEKEETNYFDLFLVSLRTRVLVFTKYQYTTGNPFLLYSILFRAVV